MSKRIGIVLSICLFVGGLSTAVYQGTKSILASHDPAPFPHPLTSGIPIHTGRTFDLTTQILYGPQLCTTYGDPFSPWNSEFHPGPYTYEYTIIIPPDYASDLVRVELFDPDSINTAVNTATVRFSQTAINHDPDRFLPGGLEMACPYSGGMSQQVQPCVIPTGELDILYEDPSLTIDQINPYWVVRLDQNRGQGPGHGDGNCGVPGSYTPRYNTQTLYELSYWAEGETDPIPLAAYTGQVGDGQRDNGGHQTDMRWVSPGGTQLPDQPVPVPADSGSFEIDLTQAVADIYVDPDNGNRYIHLGITTLSGASGQGFDIWAGPPQLDWPSDGNLRRLQMSDNLHADFSGGIQIVANGYAPRSAVHSQPLDHPLLYVGPEFAGQTITVTVFDLDAGTQPPITFFFDSLAFSAPDHQVAPIPEETDWGYLYGDASDPNTERCFHVSVPGNNRCTNQWITPTYTITIPSDDQCDYQNPTMESCTPFYGGYLNGRLAANYFDTYVWSVEGPTTSSASTGCTVFPMAPDLASYSVTPPDSGSNPFPDASEFLYPPTPPTYAQFIHHQPDQPLSFAESGTVFRYPIGINTGNIALLQWNMGIESSAQTLINSLLWPGNSRDFTDHGDVGTPIGPYPHVVRGYINPQDDTDTILEIEDPIMVYTDLVTDTIFSEGIEPHIDRDRLLRLPVAGIGPDDLAHTSAFGLFRIHGYGQSSSQTPWLLLEYMGWDESCGEPSLPPPIATMGPTPTATATPLITPTATITPTNTATPTATNTVTPSPTATATATSTPLPTATATSTASATPAITASPTHAPVTLTPTPGPFPTQTPWVTLTPSATATSMPLPTATASNTAVPTTTPTVTATPTAVPPPTYNLYLPFIQIGIE